MIRKLRSIACLLVIGCISTASGNADIASHIEAVKNEIAPLDFQVRTLFSESMQEYFKYYGLDIENTEHLFGTFSSSNHLISAHVFIPKESKGTVLVVHGYYDHAGIMKHLINNLVEQGYTVAVYDQPGHGLSSGESAAIDDFSEYTTVFRDFLKLCRASLNPPYHVVAHSMGCTAVTDYMLNTKDLTIDRVILLAPLYHSAAWNISGFGHDIAGSFIKTVPRKFRKNSSDEDFIEFMKNDPLQTKLVPMKWVNALREWNDRAEGFAVSEKTVKIIQGTDDTTVDWKYNMDFIKGKLSNVSISYVENAGHQLMNESPDLRAEVLGLVNAALSETGGNESVDSGDTVSSLFLLSGRILFHTFIIILCFAGIVLSCLSISGTWLIFTGAIIASLVGEGSFFGWGTVIVFGFVCVLVEVLEFFAGLMGVVKRGGSKMAGTAAMAGGLLGLALGTLIPVFIIGSLAGMIVGSFTLAFIVERNRLKKTDQAARIAGGTVIARLVVILLKATVTMGMTAWLLVGLLLKKM
jgi:alpha-beta hydrolase superfamily lysophospholipase/uncharacterized protein YqgC (DUF456 family)